MAGRRQRTDGGGFYRSLVEHSTAALVSVEPSGRIRFASPAAARLLGLPRNDLPGQSLPMLCDAEDGSRLLLYLDQLAAGPRERSAYIAASFRHPDQSLRTVEVTGVNLVTDEDVKAVVLLLVDVTGRARLEEELLRSATTDPLTGLVNRRGLEQALRESLEDLAAGRRREVTVCFVDLDRFKVINDLLGHANGDLILVEIAQRLDDAVRQDDLVARMGGDEFVVLLRDPGDLEQLMERLFASLDEPVAVAGTSCKVGASIGLATATAPSPSSAMEMLRRADAALYRAKAAGRGSWSRYDSQLNDWLVARRAELQDLQADYEALRASNAALERALVTDSLTHLPNRLQIDLDLERAARNATEHGVPLAAAFIDIDQFGRFNKTYGQSTGDAVLRAVAELLQSACRDVDQVYRLGGEEFVALFPGATAEEAARIADRMRRRVEVDAHRKAGLDEPVTVSIGIARYDATIVGGFRAVIDAADAAMRGAKTSGRNRVTLALGPTPPAAMD